MRSRALWPLALLVLTGCVGPRVAALELELAAERDALATLQAEHDALVASLVLDWGVNNTEMRMLGPAGGEGGVAFEQVCPEGEIMIGLVGRSGSLVDQVAVICAPIRVDATGAQPGSKHP